MQHNTGNQGDSMAQVEIQQCIQNLMACHDVCVQTAKNCQQAGGEHAQPDHILLLQDCAELCKTTANFLKHNSPLYGYLTQAAAQVATYCGQHCEQMGDMDCANACKNAAWSSEQVSKMVSY